MYHIVRRVGIQILLLQVLQDSNLDQCLMMESLFVSTKTYVCCWYEINEKEYTCF